MDTRCVFCGKRPEEPDNEKIMKHISGLYQCYCVTVVTEDQAYGNDCVNGSCDV